MSRLFVLNRSAHLTVRTLETRALAADQKLLKVLRQMLECRLIAIDLGTQPGSLVSVPDCPRGPATARVGERQERGDVGIGGEPGCVIANLIGAFGKLEHARRKEPSAQGLFSLDAVIARQVEDEDRARDIDQLVDGPRSDQFPAETVARNFSSESAGDARRRK